MTNGECCVTQRLNLVLCDNPGVPRVRSGREAQREGTYVYLQLIQVDIWQKPTQYCKEIILKLKINTFKNKDMES